MRISDGLKENILKVYEFHRMFWNEHGGFRSRKEIYRLQRNWIEALNFFISGFAFERNVTVKAYKESAIHVINNKLHVRSTLTDSRIKDIARTYYKRLDNYERLDGKKVGRNENLCPLDAREPEKSILWLCKRLSNYKYNLIKWTKKQLYHGKAEVVSHQLASVRGVSYKITALWLRDIADAFEIPVESTGEQKYLQPIDVWIYRFIYAISKKVERSFPEKMNRRSYWKAADLMIEIGNKCGIRHTLLNTAVWTYSTQIAASRGEDLSELIMDKRKFNKFHSNLENWFKTASGLF